MAAIVSTRHVIGLKELDKALAELPKATARNTLKRVLVKAGQPIADRARQNAPRDTGELQESIVVSSKVQNDVGKAEFAAAMQAGLGTQAATAALRSARRAAKGKGSFAQILVGPTKARTKAAAIKRIVQEFGSINQPPKAYMRRAWDAEKDGALEIIKRDLGDEIAKSAARVAKSAARKAAKAKAKA